MEINNKKYTRILIAKYSPRNGCDVTEGEILVIKPPMKEVYKEVSYKFEGAKNGKKSRYGWVKIVPEYTLKDFIDENLKNVSEEEQNYLSSMLDSISRLSENTAVAVDFRQKSIGESIFVIHVHKVIFYIQE